MDEVLKFLEQQALQPTKIIVESESTRIIVGFEYDEGEYPEIILKSLHLAKAMRLKVKEGYGFLEFDVRDE
jgi:hypothetical protein